MRQAETRSSVPATARPGCAPQVRGFSCAAPCIRRTGTLPHKCASIASEQGSEMSEQHNESRRLVEWTTLYALLLLLLLLSVAVTPAHSAKGYLTLGRRGIRFPCAWLERDGFFDPRNNFVSKTPFVQSRSKCQGKGHCVMNWLPANSAHALTFKLIGTDDMHDYQFQAHFCEPVYEAQHLHCTKQDGEVAFTMRQIGTWLTLSSVFCRCTRPAEVTSISYAHGINPTDIAFRGVFYEMACASMRECRVDESCFIETPNSDGLLYGGKAGLVTSGATTSLSRTPPLILGVGDSFAWTPWSIVCEPISPFRRTPSRNTGLAFAYRWCTFNHQPSPLTSERGG
ncbi:hypothetical protein EGR_01377 [Echinococcus granulosus]|uniref:DUF5731 domain-containing protein n=1 Tax=Echinococcus granulosus TaxID=6210 RepID=W6VAF4_ECHGR|nr:hypothetical protein EGR_01377 [Echinococcus granulosus]EUB63754.1 hypothetical protein EGR_01377 [Echinococcus granulosus]